MATSSMRVGLLVVLSIAVGGSEAATPSRPFSEQSPWNVRPTGVVLGTEQLPRSKYFPSIASGDYSLSVAVASPSDPPMTVLPLPGQASIWVPDAEEKVDRIEIPHWPAGVDPAKGSDGHAEIVDVAGKRIHSFFFLRSVDGRWRTAQYTWTRLDGRGWGDPAHYFQGSRATGVPALAGLIRKDEVDDGQATYAHALAMSLPREALSRDPTYVFPATSADSGSEQNHHGRIPEGALMMLPPDFDAASMRDARLAKVVRTLMHYGAYVVDENDGTPFAIYVENGADFDLHKGGWRNEVAADLDRIRGALRQVVEASGWLDARGKPVRLARSLNLLSLRGPWQPVGPGPGGRFDSWEQAVLFPPSASPIVQTNLSGRSMQPVPWALPRAGASLRLKVEGSAGSTLQLDLMDLATGKQVFTSGPVPAGGERLVTWPSSPSRPVVTISSGPTGGGRVSATLAVVDPP